MSRWAGLALGATDPSAGPPGPGCLAWESRRPVLRLSVEAWGHSGSRASDGGGVVLRPAAN